MINEKINEGTTWLDRLEILVIKFAHMGIEGDLAALSQADAWGLYCYLTRLDS